MKVLFSHINIWKYPDCNITQKSLTDFDEILRHGVSQYPYCDLDQEFLQYSLSKNKIARGSQ